MGLSPSTVSAFQGLDEQSQRTALGGMSMPAKQALLQALQNKPADSGPVTLNAKRGGSQTTSIPPVPDFLDRVGQSIETSVNVIPNALRPLWDGPSAADQAANQAAAQSARQLTAPPTWSQGMPKAVQGTAGALSVVPRMASGMVQRWWKDPANLVGDAVLASPELAEVKLPGNKQFSPAGSSPPPPPAMTVTPEAQAAYDAAVRKASTGFRDNALSYNDKLSEQFDTARQEQIANSAKEQAAKAAYDQKVQAAQQSQQQAADLAQHKQTLIDTQNSLAEDTRQRAQALYQQNRSQLNNRWDQMRDAVGSETPTPVTGVVDALNKAETDYLRGSPGSVQKFRQLVNELGIKDLTGMSDADEATAKPGRFYQVNEEQPDAPWQTIRTHSSAISRAMASGDLGNVYPAMRLVRDALESAAGDTAEAAGQGDAYRQLRSDEGQFRKDFEDLGPISLGKGNPAARLVRAPNATFAADIIHGKASDLLEQALGRWDQSGTLPANVQQMRSIADDLKALPKNVKVLPTPEPYQPGQPVIPERKPPGSPEYPEVQPPRSTPIPTPTTLGQRIIQHGSRVAGKVIGGTVGSAVGHPLIGYGIGGEIGSEVGKALTKKPPAPPPSLPPIPRTLEDYTRTLLSAKDGDLTPKQAADLIRKGGGSTKTIPLPPQP